MKRNEWSNKIISISTTIFILSISLSSFFTIQTAIAETIYIESNDSLQNEINNSTNGDILQINASINLSTYININKSITIQGKIGSSVQINGSGFGLNITNSSVIIKNITINNCSTAISIENVTQSIENITINNVTIANCSIYGLYIHNTTQVNITNSTLTNCTLSGIFLHNTSNGTLSDNSILTSNAGLNITNSSTNNAIHNNTFTNNSISLNITSSYQNNIYNNSFFNCTLYHAYDNSTNNWNTTTHGNYWDDYNGTDEDNNSIGDKNYSITGGSNVDEKPLGFFVPIIYFTYSPLSPSTNDNIHFNSSNSTDPNNVLLNYSWNFGDGNTSYEQNPTHNYSNNNTYNVTLEITNTYGLSNQTNQTIIVLNSPPTVSFNISPTPGIVNETMSFKVNASDNDGAITNWTWSFGDGEKNYSQNTTHEYSQNGSFIAYMNATDDDGNYTNISKTITITFKPSVNFTYSPSFPTTNETITFSDNSTDTDSTIASRSWNFGDGDTSTNQNPTHSYENNINYIVTLTITDSHGATNQTTKTISISNSHPIANFSYSPQTPTDLHNITFTDNSTDSDGTIVNWTWTFGDSSTNYAQNATHQFSDNGTYTVTLNVTDNDGGTNETSFNITVLNVVPTADFSFEPTYPQIGDTVWFNDSSSDDDGTIVNWTWTFGDSSTNYSQNTTHSFSSFQSYDVTLTIKDNDGSISTKTKQIILRKTYSKEISKTHPTSYDLITESNTYFTIKTENTTNVSVSIYSEKPYEVSGNITSFQNLETYVNISIENESILDWMNLSLYYTTNNIENKNIDESSLVVFYWNVTQNKWIAIESLVNTTNTDDFSGFVTVNITHLTIFTLGGKTIEEDITTPILPSISSSFDNTTFNTSTPVLMITYDSSTIIDSALLNGSTINITTADNKTFIFYLYTPLSNGNYTIQVTIINGSLSRTDLFYFSINNIYTQGINSFSLVIPSWLIYSILGLLIICMFYLLFKKTQFISIFLRLISQDRKPKTQTSKNIKYDINSNTFKDTSFSSHIQQISSTVDYMLFDNNNNNNNDIWGKTCSQLEGLLNNIDLFVEKPDVYVDIQEKLILEDGFCIKIFDVLQKKQSSVNYLKKETKMSLEELSQSLSILLKYGLIELNVNETFSLTYSAKQLELTNHK